MVVEKVQMTSRQARDLGERGIDGLGIERPAALEERLLVTEIAHMRTPARHDDGVRNEIERPLDEIPTDPRNADERADL